MAKTRYHRTTVNGLEIFYREAGDRRAPTVLLLHGFPTASHMFRDLIPVLATDYHVIAPDLPGFGQSTMPPASQFKYTFENLANVVGGFLDRLQIGQFAVYVFDYGAPVGFRLALSRPEAVTAIITQNGNAYEEGLSSGWRAMREFWAAPTAEFRDSLRAAFTPAATAFQYEQGSAASDLVSKDGQNLDNLYLMRVGAQEPQLDLFEDYGSNIGLYASIQEYFRRYQPPLLAVWGENDPYFLPAGAHAFRRDLHDARVRLFPTGHFALETHVDEISTEILAFLAEPRLGQTSPSAKRLTSEQKDKKTMSNGHMILSAFFFNPQGDHRMSWRHPAAPGREIFEFSYYRRLAEAAEHAKLDAIFLADHVAIWDSYESNIAHYANARLEPLTVLSGLAAVTKDIGLISTASTSYTEPYNLARTFASLDHLSGGRAGWNVVTSGMNEEAMNFGRDGNIEHQFRYERAAEFLDTAKALWDSLEDEALLFDKAGGFFADPARVHRIDHQGKHFKVRGPLNVPRPLQGYPVIVQAGSSGDGKNLAAKHAEINFSLARSIDEGKKNRAEFNELLAVHGRPRRA